MKNITILAIMSIVCAWAVDSAAMNNNNEKKSLLTPQKLISITLHNHTYTVCTAGEVRSPLLDDDSRFVKVKPKGNGKKITLQGSILTLIFSKYGILISTPIDPNLSETYSDIGISYEEDCQQFYPFLYYETDRTKLANQTISILDVSTTPPTVKPYLEA